MAAPYRCTLCLQVGRITDKANEPHMKVHLGAPSIHNMGQYACQFPGCGRYSYRVDRNENHNDDQAVADHQAVWVVDQVRLAALDRAAAACRLPHAVVGAAAGPGPGPGPGAPHAAGPAAPIVGHVAPIAGHVAATPAVLPGPPVTAQVASAAPSATQVAPAAPAAPVVPTPGPTAPTAPTLAGAQGQNNLPGAGQGQTFPDSTEFTLFRDPYMAIMADRERERYRNEEQ